MKKKKSRKTPQSIPRRESSSTSSHTRKGLKGNNFSTTVIPKASSSTNQQILTHNASSQTEALEGNNFSQHTSRENNDGLRAAIQSLAHSQAETKDILRSILKTLSAMQQSIDIMQKDINIIKQDINIMKQDIHIMKHDFNIIKQDNKLNNRNICCLYDVMVADDSH